MPLGRGVIGERWCAHAPHGEQALYEHVQKEEDHELALAHLTFSAPSPHASMKALQILSVSSSLPCPSAYFSLSSCRRFPSSSLSLPPTAFACFENSR